MIIVAAAVILGLFAVYLTNAYFSGVEAQQEKVAEEQQLVRIAVASQDLDFGSPLTTDTVRLVNWPSQSVPAGAITDMSKFAGTDVAIRPIAAGEPILQSRMSTRAVLSENIPDNLRAVTIPVNDVAGVAGFVTPGDVVDVMMTRTIPGGEDEKVTAVVLENVQVIAIDRRASAGRSGQRAEARACIRKRPPVAGAAQCRKPSRRRHPDRHHARSAGWTSALCHARWRRWWRWRCGSVPCASRRSGGPGQCRRAQL